MKWRANSILNEKQISSMWTTLPLFDQRKSKKGKMALPSVILRILSKIKKYYLEMINGNKILEKWKDIFNF